MSTELAIRVTELERDTRTQLHQVRQEVATERGITRDLVEALHTRIDRWENEMLLELRAIKAAVNGNGHG